MKNKQFKIQNFITILSFICLLCIGVFAQETPPAPSAPKSIAIPAVKEKDLSNGLTVAVVERKTIPLVTVNLVTLTGASSESQIQNAGLANMTASLLTKGTKTRTATDIAEQMEFLGGSINSGASWNNSFVSITLTSDKLDKGLAIMSDVVLNPKFDEKEIDLLKTQTLDGLTYNLSQPGFLANYVTSVYTFGEHPAGGTPDSIKSLERAAFLNFYKSVFTPKNSVLIFTGDISAAQANALAKKYFSAWKNPTEPKNSSVMTEGVGVMEEANRGLVKRILVVDLPDAGQAAVKYAVNMPSITRNDKNEFYPALVLNSVLGGGYSSRLNQEIRIKRGLSYGAGSGFAWRKFSKAVFSTSTQTKNESAAEVAELVIEEVQKLMEGSIANAELDPRKAVLTGDFGREMETTSGLATLLAALYTYNLPTSEMNSHMQSVRAVSEAQIKKFASENLKGGDIIIVGNYSMFKDDLAKRFPNMKIQVIEASQIDLTKVGLKK